MKFYETMYIVHPILEMGRLLDLITDIEKILSEKGGELVYTKVIGKKRMAYPISKQKFGTYVLIQFKGDGAGNNDFSVDLEHNPNVLRHMIINIDESEIKEQSEDIKDQITGLTRPTSSSEENKTEKPKEVDKTAENNEAADSETPVDESSVETEKVEEAPTKEEAETAETTEE